MIQAGSSMKMEANEVAGGDRKTANLDLSNLVGMAMSAALVRVVIMY